MPRFFPIKSFVIDYAQAFLLITLELGSAFDFTGVLIFAGTFTGHIASCISLNSKSMYRAVSGKTHDSCVDPNFDPNITFVLMIIVWM